MPDLDGYLVRHALTVAREQGYVEVEVGVEGATFTAVLEPRKTAAKAARTSGAPEAEPEARFIKSSLVGYIQKLDLAVGDEVKQGQLVAVVTALGIANDIESQASGTVAELLAKEGEPVEFGQPLARVV